MDDPEPLPDESEAQLGRVVASKYRLSRLLGKGGMGAVYEAENTWTHRRVAIKLLRARLTTDRDLVSRFLQEARAASALKHPNIVDVLDMGREPGDGTLYIVQELLDGQSLRARLTETPRLAPEEAIRILAPILTALDVAHARGVIHRDLKPENIFLVQGADGEVAPKLIDFGIAKVVREDFNAAMHRTRTGSMLGTPAYMSPEQARSDKSIDARSDVWSAGVVLYEMLCGRCPFGGESVGLTIAQIITEEAPRIETFAPELSPELVAIIHRALERDRERRHPSAMAFREALLACPTAAHTEVVPLVRPSLTHADTLDVRERPDAPPADAPSAQDTPARASHERDLAPPRPPSTRRRVLFGGAVLGVAALTLWELAGPPARPVTTRAALSASAPPLHPLPEVAHSSPVVPATPTAPALRPLDAGVAPPVTRNVVPLAHAKVEARPGVRPPRVRPDAGAAHTVLPADAPSPGVAARATPGDALRPANRYP